MYRFVKSRIVWIGTALIGALSLFLGIQPANATTFTTGGIFGVGANLCVHASGDYTDILTLQWCGQSNEQFHMNSTSYRQGWVDFVYTDTSNGQFCITSVPSGSQNGASLYLNGCNGQENQAWRFGCVSAQGRSGTWSYIISPANYVFNDYGGHQQPGDLVAQWAWENPLPTSEIFDPMGYNTCSSGD